MSGFSERMKQIRLSKGMSQEEFADFLGTSKQNISRYESGEVSPKISTASQIARKLGVSLSYLSGESDEILAGYDNAWTLREEEREDPDRKALFRLLKNGSARDIKQAVAILGVLRATNPEYYDGDDPA